MADLKIPNLNKNSDRYILKKKLTLRKKSKKRIRLETLFMLISSSFLIFLVYIIPNKKSIFNNFLNNIDKLIANLLDSISYSYEILLVIFIVISLILSFIFFLGAFSRLMKIIKKKSRQITYR